MVMAHDYYLKNRPKTLFVLTNELQKTNTVTLSLIKRDATVRIKQHEHKRSTNGDGLPPAGAVMEIYNLVLSILGRGKKKRWGDEEKPNTGVES